MTSLGALFLEQVSKMSGNSVVRKMLRNSELSQEATESLMRRCVCDIQLRFHNGLGISTLSNSVMACGKNFMVALGHQEDKSQQATCDTAKFGAAVIDSLIFNGFLLMQKEEGQRGGYIILPDDKWATLPSQLGSVIANAKEAIVDRPEDIKGYKHPNNRLVIKKSNKEWFKEAEGSVHLKGLNKMMQSPNRVNKAVLEIVKNTPYDTSPVRIPRRGSKKIVDFLFRKLKKDESFREEYENANAEWQMKREALKERSLKTERGFIITKADEYSSLERFYDIPELDYRGRAYYTNQYLHYQGNDLMKGLLQFAEGVAVTERGYWWLMAQAATCFNQSYTIEELKQIDWLDEDYVALLEKAELEDISVDKMSLDDRFNWSVNNSSFILSVDSILENAEEPTMFLATCLELQGVEREGLGYISHLPVAVDGSQNVSQHVSAINGDAYTAAKVGIVPTKVPLDLYVEVGAAMREMYPEFFETRGMTMKAIRKNISKRATMVRQYSAGQHSIAENMFNDCQKTGADKKYGITSADCMKLASVAIKGIDKVLPSNGILKKYLQKLVKHEMGEVKVVGKDGEDMTKMWHYLMDIPQLEERHMEILKDLTMELVKGNGADEISWTSPSGFPVKTRMFCKQSIPAKVFIMGKQIKMRVQWYTDIPNAIDQYSAIAANTVHSHDSAHAMNILSNWVTDSVVVIHDSFATHASNVDDLIYIIKETFIEMYPEGKNYYEVMRENILTSDQGFDVETPQVGDLDLTLLRKADFFFA